MVKVCLDRANLCCLVFSAIELNVKVSECDFGNFGFVELLVLFPSNQRGILWFLTDNVCSYLSVVHDAVKFKKLPFQAVYL